MMRILEIMLAAAMMGTLLTGCGNGYQEKAAQQRWKRPFRWRSRSRKGTGRRRLFI